MFFDLVIIGGGISAVRTAEAARDAGFDGTIAIFGDENHFPYERPPLSKQVLAGVFNEGTVFPRTYEEFQAKRIDVHIDVRAVSLFPELNSVELSDGQMVEFGALVIATGSRSRQLPFDAPQGVRTIRTLDDSLSIAAALKQKPRVAIIGAGFVGLEVASTAKALGCEVTLIESGRVPLTRSLGPTMGSHCAALHEANGVEVINSGNVLGFTANDDAVSGVILDGFTLAADLVIVGIGALPNQEWLADSGLPISNGVECDATGRVQGYRNIFAVGDVAAWFSEEQGRFVRREHWTSAAEQGDIVGRQIAGEIVEAIEFTPYFWSDQHGVKIQMVGEPAAVDELSIVAGSLESGRFTALYLNRGNLSAALTFDSPRHLALLRGLVARKASLDDAQQALGLVSSAAS